MTYTTKKAYLENALAIFCNFFPDVQLGHKKRLKSTYLTEIFLIIPVWGSTVADAFLARASHRKRESRSIGASSLTHCRSVNHYPHSLIRELNNGTLSDGFLRQAPHWTAPFVDGKQENCFTAGPGQGMHFKLEIITVGFGKRTLNCVSHVHQFFFGLSSSKNLYSPVAV